MTCERFRLEDGSVAFICHKGKKLPPCVVCGAAGTRLCDGIWDRLRYPRASGSKTCDRPLCDFCTVQADPPLQLQLDGTPAKADPRDFCPAHVDQARRTIVRALTIHAPWAWAIVEGHKPIENRDWKPFPNQLRDGEIVAIHQGKTYDEEGALWIRQRFGLYVPTAEEFQIAGELGAFVGAAKFRGVVEDPGDLFPDLDAEAWWIGPIGFRFEEPRRLRPAIAARGMQKLWNVRREDEATILNRLGTW